MAYIVFQIINHVNPSACKIHYILHKILLKQERSTFTSFVLTFINFLLDP